MISTVTNRGKLRFMMYKKSLNAEVLIKFLRRLTKVNDRKIFLILDNLQVNHAYKVRDWIKERESYIKKITYRPIHRN